MRINVNSFYSSLKCDDKKTTKRKIYNDILYVVFRENSKKPDTPTTDVLKRARAKSVTFADLCPKFKKKNVFTLNG